MMNSTIPLSSYNSSLGAIDLGLSQNPPESKIDDDSKTDILGDQPRNQTKNLSQKYIQELLSLQNQLKRNTEECRKAEKERSELEERLIGLENQLNSTVEEELNDLRTKLQESENNLDFYKNQLLSSKKQIERLKSKINQLQNDNDNCDIKITEISKKYEKTMIELNLTRKKLEAAEIAAKPFLIKFLDWGKSKVLQASDLVATLVPLPPPSSYDYGPSSLLNSASSTISPNANGSTSSGTVEEAS